MTLFQMDRVNGLDCGGRWRMVPVNQLGTHVTVENIDQVDIDGNPVRLSRVRRTWLISIPDVDARTSDPATAHAAADLQTDSVKRASHRLVLTILQKYGPMTDHALGAQMSRELNRNVGHDNAGKRRLEVQRMGFVEKTGDTATTPSGAQAHTYRISQAGKRELANWSYNPRPTQARHLKAVS